MGMVWTARLADQDQAAKLMADPDSAVDFINPEEGWEEAAPDTLDLDKEWHGTHYLLTGSAGPTGDALSLVLGDYEEVGEDIGYGPAFYIPPERLRAFHEAISILDNRQLHDRYHPEAMVKDQVYLADAYQRDGDEGFEFLLERVQAMRDFASKAAASGRGAFAAIT
jgi:hypothetical protein